VRKGPGELPFCCYLLQPLSMYLASWSNERLVHDKNVRKNARTMKAMLSDDIRDG
jgi:hypothetical protein